MKVVIVILVAIFLLLVAAIALGATREEGGVGVTQHGLVQAVKDLFQKEPTPVALQDLSGPCIGSDEITLTNGQLCVVEIAESGAFSRRMTIQSSQGTINFSFAREGQITIRKTLLPSDPSIKVNNIGRDGGTFSLLCADPLGCTLSVLRPD